MRELQSARTARQQVKWPMGGLCAGSKWPRRVLCVHSSARRLCSAVHGSDPCVVVSVKITLRAARAFHVSEPHKQRGGGPDLHVALLRFHFGYVLWKPLARLEVGRSRKVRLPHRPVCSQLQKRRLSAQSQRELRLLPKPQREPLQAAAGSRTARARASAGPCASLEPSKALRPQDLRPQASPQRRSIP